MTVITGVLFYEIILLISDMINDITLRAIQIRTVFKYIEISRVISKIIFFFWH